MKKKKREKKRKKSEEINNEGSKMTRQILLFMILCTASTSKNSFARKDASKTYRDVVNEKMQDMVSG